MPALVVQRKGEKPGSSRKISGGCPLLTSQGVHFPLSMAMCGGVKRPTA